MTNTMLVHLAAEFATQAHTNQIRKYTHEPYIQHLAEVAGYIATCMWSLDCEPEVALATCWLHDVLEDTDEIIPDSVFGTQIWAAVILLSDFEVGNRAHRQELKRCRLSLANKMVQTVKVADLISNAHSIRIHDPKFWLVYKKEAMMLLQVLSKADQNLKNRLHQELIK
jgi:(p)ppGpp synthase/HD superfamily hydrolase